MWLEELNVGTVSAGRNADRQRGVWWKAGSVKRPRTAAERAPFDYSSVTHGCSLPAFFSSWYSSRRSEVKPQSLETMIFC